MKSKKNGGFPDRGLDSQALHLLGDLMEKDAEGTSYQNEEIPIFPNNSKSHMGEQIQSSGCWSALSNSNQSTKTPTETHKSSNADSAGRRENRMSDGCRPHVHFKDSVIVILIPCRLEYFSAGLTPILWWMKSDFVLFRKSAIAEFAHSKRLRGTPLNSVAKNFVQHSEFHPLFREATNYLFDTVSLDREPSKLSILGEESLC